MDLTVCTYNTLHGTAPRQNERYDFTALTGLDVVGFQETDRDAWFAAMRSAYVGRFRAPKGPLRENTVAWSPLWTLKASGYRMTHRGLAKVSPHRGFTWVILGREGVTVGVLNTHLVSGVRGDGKFPVGWRRRRWARHMVALRVQVAKLLTSCDHVVVLGDFNEVGPKVDIPGLNRLTPDDSIDHIFVSPGLHSLGVVNLARRGSDHAPRVATLTTRPVIPEPPKPDPEVIVTDDRYELTTHDGKTVDRYTDEALKEAEKRLGYTLTISQGSYHRGVGASAGTHDGGGVIDLVPFDWERKVRVLRSIGFAAWHRTPAEGPWPEHIHAVLIGNDRASDSAKRQVDSYRRGRNGLKGDGPDTFDWRPKNIRPYVYPQPSLVETYNRKIGALLTEAQLNIPKTRTAEHKGLEAMAKILDGMPGQ